MTGVHFQDKSRIHFYRFPFEMRLTRLNVFLVLEGKGTERFTWLFRALSPSDFRIARILSGISAFFCELCVYGCVCMFFVGGWSGGCLTVSWWVVCGCLSVSITKRWCAEDIARDLTGLFSFSFRVWLQRLHEIDFEALSVGRPAADRLHNQRFSRVQIGSARRADSSKFSYSLVCRSQNEKLSRGLTLSKFSL